MKCKEIEMVLPPKLISEVKALGLSVQLEAVALDICNGLYWRSYFDKYLPVNKKKYEGSKNIKGVTEKNVNALLLKLVKVGILKRDYFKKNEKSFHYRISKAYKEFTVYNPNNPLIALIRKEEKRKGRYIKEKQEHYLNKMEARVKEIKWDMSTIWDWINNYQPTEKELKIRNSKHPKSKPYTMEQYKETLIESMTYTMLNISMGKYHFKRDSTSMRLHTSISNMKTELLKRNLENLYEIDIRNSQPFFLKILIEYFVTDKKHKYNTINIENRNNTFFIVSYIDSLVSENHQYIGDKSIIQHLFNSSSSKNELLRFSTFVDSGKFYEPFMEKAGLSRDESKVLMYKILFSKNTSFKKDKQIFSKMYPSIFQFTEWIKENNYKLLSNLLQCLESYIVITVLSKRLVENGIVPITKHDSIIIKPHQKEKALSIFKEVMQQVCGSVPSLKVQQLK